jgi:ribosome recycling factor
MIDEVLADIERRMRKAIEHFRHDLAALRTGRATPALLEHVQVDYYGTPTPVNQLATVSVPEPRVLLIQPWDRATLQTIERAILKSDLGITPNSDGTVIRLVLPQPTQERRKELVKQLHKRTEETRVAIRNARRDGVDKLKQAEKDKKLSADDCKRGQERLQKLTDRMIAEAEEIARAKEQEIMTV